MAVEENLDESLIIRPAHLGVAAAELGAGGVDRGDQLAFDLSHDGERCELIQYYTLSVLRASERSNKIGVLVLLANFAGHNLEVKPHGVLLELLQRAVLDVAALEGVDDHAEAVLLTNAVGFFVEAIHDRVLVGLVEVMKLAAVDEAINAGVSTVGGDLSQAIEVESVAEDGSGDCGHWVDV